VSPAYASGHLFFRKQGTLFAQRFELERLSLAGDPFPVADGVGVVAAPESSTASVTLAFRAESGGRNLRQFVWVDRAGNVLEKLGEPFDGGGTMGPALSPDESTIAVARSTAGSSSDSSDLWLMDTKRGIFRRFTDDPFINNAPVFSPDGSRIVFQTNPKGVLDLYIKDASGVGAQQLVLETAAGKLATDWRGRFLLYQGTGSKTGWDIWALPMDGPRQPISVVQTTYDERNAEFSPDGRWVAYQSDESGQSEIYVQPFPGPGRKERISTNGGEQVRWSSDGKELFYIGVDDRLMSVPVRIHPDKRLEAGTAVPLFTTNVSTAEQQLTRLARQQYMVSRDGKRFLTYLFVEQLSNSPITVILNWSPEQRK
jgi:Tol biopolymer transport system component